MQRNVEMNAPFRQLRIANFGLRIFSGKRIRQIAEDFSCAGGVAFHDLMQIDVVGKFFLFLARGGRGRNFERGTQMDFADLDAVSDEAGQGVMWFLKFHGEMAGVVIDAKVRVEARVVRMLGAQAVKKMNRLGAAFEEAERFGFEAEVQIFAGLLADVRDVLDGAPEILADGF